MWKRLARAAAMSVVGCGVALVAIGTLSGAQDAQAATINFDSLSSGDLVDNAFVGLGVTFEDAVVSNTSGTSPGATSPNTIVHAVDGIVVSPSDPIIAIFSSAVTGVSVAGFDVGPDGIVLNAFDAQVGGSLVDTAQSSVFGDNIILTVLNPNILRVELSKLSSDSPGDGVSFDNFVFEPVSAVPLPAALPLFGTGLGILGFWGGGDGGRLSS